MTLELTNAEGIVNKKLYRMFPYLDDKEKLSKIKIDKDSIHYISPREYADKITNIIKQHLFKLNLDVENICLTDCTAGVGGNTISFALTFKSVISIEIDKLR